MRKILSGVMAAALCLSLSVTAFAASGYSVGGETPTNTQAASRAEDAINKAISSGSNNAVVSFQNVTTLTSSAIQAVAEKAASKQVETKIQVDKVENNAVVSRWYIDPKVAANLPEKLNLDVQVSGKTVETTTNFFKKHFTNELSVVSLGQQGSFGTDLDLAVKVDLSKLDRSKLVFYVYDRTSNTYKQITPAYFVDANGYLHFAASEGGEILITDSKLNSVKAD